MVPNEGASMTEMMREEGATAPAGTSASAADETARQDAATAPSDAAAMTTPASTGDDIDSFHALRGDGSWWMARPAGSNLVGLVIARDDMPSVVEQRDALTRFGVQIDGFRHPAPEILETWEERLARLFGTLRRGDVLVVANTHALGRTVDDEARTLAELQRRGVMVKVVSHDGSHLSDADR